MIREEKKCWDFAVSSGHVFPLRRAKGRLESGRLWGLWACGVGGQGWPRVEAIFFPIRPGRKVTRVVF